MKNIIDFIKEKSYYFLGGTVLLLILIIAISSCSTGGESYSSIENNMKSAAKKYYTDNEDLLPTQIGNSVKVSLDTLIEIEYLKEVKDPNNKNNLCTGYVEVVKLEEDYSYVPMLKCKDNYEPEYLVDIIKKSGTDDIGNGIYEINGEFIYRGENINNYVLFNDIVWRIVKINSNGNIKLVAANKSEDTYSWDTRYNSDKGYSYGITTDYKLTNMRKTLNEYYNNIFTNDNKGKIVLEKICIGSCNENSYDKTQECTKTIEDEYVSLLNLSDYQIASLDAGCTNPMKKECVNRNYLNSNDINTWLLNPVEGYSFKMYVLNGSTYYTNASNVKKINPVIYLNKNVITVEGKGTLEAPYKIK